VILKSIYTPEQVDTAIAELARLESLESSGPASKGGRNAFEGFQTKRIYALADKSRTFDCFPIHDTVMKLNDYFLQPHCLMTSYHTVNIEPGSREQEIHTDDGLVALPRPRPLMGIVCPLYTHLGITNIGQGTMVSLDAFTKANGATTLIPGSHLWGDDREPTRDQMIPAIMPAGSMLYFLNTVWHSGGANRSNKPRRSLTVQYCQPWLRTYENMTVAMGWENLDQVPKRLLALMGFSTHEFMGYVDGRAPRTGVEMRKKRLVEWALREREKVRGSKL
jgi:ectoine hydroxylase-related dioxygenase (phytanoyl-CoA dioxygenase family)